MESLEKFNSDQIGIVNDAVITAEELVNNYYKLSSTQWLQFKYDIYTLADLAGDEIVFGAFAHVIRWEGKQKDSDLGSAVYDFYKVCLQDHAILGALSKYPDIHLFPLSLYLVTHELIHIVRFSKFLQYFDASEEEKSVEETRVHGLTHDILQDVRVSGMDNVLHFYQKWRLPIEKIR